MSAREIIMCPKCGAAKQGKTMLSEPRLRCDGAPERVSLEYWKALHPKDRLTEAGRAALAGKAGEA